MCFHTTAFADIPTESLPPFTVTLIDRTRHPVRYVQYGMVMDRGFYSETNVNALYKDHLKFLLAASTSLKLIRRELDRVKDELDS